MRRTRELGKGDAADCQRGRHCIGTTLHLQDGSGHSTTQRYTTTENYRGPDTRPDYLR